MRSLSGLDLVTRIVSSMTRLSPVGLPSGALFLPNHLANAGP